MDVIKILILLCLCISLASAIDYSQIKDNQGAFYNCRTSPTNLCYDLDYSKTYCSAHEKCSYNSQKLPVEGEKVIYWPNISILNLTSNPNNISDLALIYYLVDPSGKALQPDFIALMGLKVGISFESSQGIPIDSSFPGYWEINSLLVPLENVSNFLYLKNLSQEIVKLPFKSQKVHILSYSENINEKISTVSLWVSIFALITSLIFSIITFYREHRRQKGLLQSLYSELDALSNKQKKITILGKDISTKGNIQWVRELFEDELKPAHSIWKINAQDYVKNLNERISFRETKSLKEILIHISQKIELIENHLSKYDLVPKEQKEIIKEIIINILDETIILIDTTKEYIKKEFKIN